MTKLKGKPAIDNLLGLDYKYLWTTDKPVVYYWRVLLRRTRLVWK